MYKFGELRPIILKFMLLKHAIFIGIWPQFDDLSSLVTLAFQMD